MIYIFIDFEGFQKWIEVDESAHALRQITNDGKRIFTSCRNGYLAEGIVDTVNNCKQISKSDFENIWYDATHKLRSVWDVSKQKYPIGERVSGVAKYLYPQGAIFDLGDIQGCTNRPDIEKLRGARSFPTTCN